MAANGETIGVGRLAAIFAGALALVMAAAAPLAAETRMALVIGNANYAHGGKLSNPAHDAALIAQALQSVGFTVISKTDLGRDDLENALKAFARDSAGADTAVVYFSGHGMEIGGTNYLIPIDAVLEDDTAIQFEAVPLDLVMTAVGRARRLKVVVLDACRNNPFFDAMRRSNSQKDISVGLARPVAQSGMLIAYAAREGTTAANGTGDNSPYAIALARHLTETGVDVRVLFGEVHEDVLTASGGRQEPSAYESIGGQGFYLTPSTAGAANTAANTSRLELALIADDPAKAVGALLRAYGDPAKTYPVERDLTLPGDIEQFNGGLDEQSRPVFRIRLSDAAVNRVNSDSAISGRRIALVLDGRTVLSVADVRANLYANIDLTGNFSAADVQRLVAAITPRGAGR